MAKRVTSLFNSTILVRVRGRLLDSPLSSDVKLRLPFDRLSALLVQLLDMRVDKRHGGLAIMAEVELAVLTFVKHHRILRVAHFRDADISQIRVERIILFALFLESALPQLVVPDITARLLHYFGGIERENTIP